MTDKQMILKSLSKEKKLMTLMIDALAREDRTAIEYYQEEYKKIKQKTDSCLNELSMDIIILDLMSDEPNEILQNLDNIFEDIDYNEIKVKAIELMLEKNLIKLSNEKFSSLLEEKRRILLDIVVWYLRNNEFSPNARNSTINIFSLKLISSEAIRNLFAGNIEYSNILSNPNFSFNIFANHLQQNEIKIFFNDDLREVINLDKVHKAIEINPLIGKEVSPFLKKQKLYQELELATLSILMQKYNVTPAIPEEIKITPFMEEVITNAEQIASEYNQDLQKGFSKSKKMKVIYAKK